MPTMLALLLVVVAVATAQRSNFSNYDKQAVSVYYEETGRELSQFGTLDGTVTQLDPIPSTISLNKTSAELNCSSGFMNVKMKFQRPFYGIVYGDFDRNSACKITGSGRLEETLQLPLKGCGTLQSPVRVFTNNVIVRFHPGLEIDGDEVITVICRYPAPVASPPVPPPVPLQLPPASVVRTLQPLREFEILLIICAIIFLALMLLGIGCSYYCLKKRNIRVIRRRPASTLGSEVTKISEPVSMFGGLKIPRAHAEDTSGSEELAESVRSDFAFDDLASTVTEEDCTSAYSDAPFELAAGSIYPILHSPPAPTFDIMMSVKKNAGERSVSPVSSRISSSGSELLLKAQEQYLTTILETTETNTLETLERTRKLQMGLNDKVGPPPVHARLRILNRNNNNFASDTSELESESEYSQVTDDFYHDKLQLSTAGQANFTLDSNDCEHREERALHHGEQITEAILEEVGQSLTTHQSLSNNHLIASTDHEAVTFTLDMKEGYSQVVNDMKEEHREELHPQSQDLITPVILDRQSEFRERRRNNFDVLIQVLESQNVNDDDDDDADDDAASSILTEDERYRLREVITQNESIRTMLMESYTREKMFQLKDHMEQVIKPEKWDVLIRVIHNSSNDKSPERMETVSCTSTSTATAQEVRSMREVMVDFSTSQEWHQEGKK